MILSIIAVVISALAVIVTLLIYRLASAPNVIMYLNSHSESDVVIVVENIGRKAAHDITFPSEMLADILSPISCLVPNQRRIFLWGSYRELQEKLNEKIVPVNVKYYRETGQIRKSAKKQFSLDIAILKHTLPEQNNLTKINNSLERISNSLRSIEVANRRGLG